MGGRSQLSWYDCKAREKISCSWQSARCSLYKSLNGILGVLGSRPSFQVVLALVRASCFPIILYGLDALSLSPTEVHHLAFAYNNIFVNLFQVKEVNCIEHCQYFCNFWPFRAVYEFKRYLFLSQYFERHGPCVMGSLDYADYLELDSIANKYKFYHSDSKACLKVKV